MTPTQAQGVATVVVYVTVPPSSTPAATIIPQAESTERQQQDDRSTPLPLSSGVTASVSSSTLSLTSQSVHEATSSQTQPAFTSAASTASTYYEPGQSGGGGIDTEGGASGSDAAAFHLSKAGLAAILIVVILVSLFGSKCDDTCTFNIMLTYTQSQESCSSSSPNDDNGPCVRLLRGLLAA
jgi:hypothetical protein